MKGTESNEPQVAGAVTLEAVQWGTLTDVDDVEPVSDKDYEVLEEIRQVLAKHQRTGRFGVCLLHKHFEVGGEEVAVEYTDTDARTSTVRVEPRGPEGNYLQTMWRFSEEPYNVTVCVRRCNYNSGHKNVHMREAR